MRRSWYPKAALINGTNTTNSNVLKSEDGPDTVTHLLQSPRDSRTQQWAQGHSWRQCKKHLWNPHLSCHVFVMFDFISFSYHQVRYREMLPAELANRIKVTSTKTGQKCCMTEMQVSSLSLPTLVNYLLQLGVLDSEFLKTRLESFYFVGAHSLVVVSLWEAGNHCLK